MDPVSQGALGAAASQAVSTKKELAMAGVMGFLSGMAADLDILIGSDNDPLLFLEYHRQFTHSLLFMPIGGLICACIFWLLFHNFSKTSAPRFQHIYLYSFVGYASHGLLDSCTSYGTQLFWPFSNERFAWNNVSIVDPLFTLPLLLLLGLTIAKRSKLLSYLTIAYAISYLTLGLIQENRASDSAYQLAYSRGHTPLDLSVKPSFMNLIVWKSIYHYQGRYYVDAIHVSTKSRYFAGDSTRKFSVSRDMPWLDSASQQAKDISRFAWFSDDHLALDATNPLRIIDMRYSMLPNRLDGLWGIELSKTASITDHVKWTHNRGGSDRDENIKILWSMIKGINAEEIPS